MMTVIAEGAHEGNLAKIVSKNRHNENSEEQLGIGK